MEECKIILGVPVLATLKEIYYLSYGKYGAHRCCIGLYHCDTRDNRPYLVVLSASDNAFGCDRFCIMQDQWYKSYSDALRHYNRHILQCMRNGRI